MPRVFTLVGNTIHADNQPINTLNAHGFGSCCSANVLVGFHPYAESDDECKEILKCVQKFAEASGKCLYWQPRSDVHKKFVDAAIEMDIPRGPSYKGNYGNYDMLLFAFYPSHRKPVVDTLESRVQTGPFQEPPAAAPEPAPRAVLTPPRQDGELGSLLKRKKKGLKKRLVTTIKL